MMGDKTLESLWVKLGIDTSGIVGQVTQISFALNQSLELFSKFEQAAQAFIDLANNAAEYNSQISRLSTLTGMNAEEIQRWDRVAKMADTDVSTLATTISRMQVRLNAHTKEGQDNVAMLHSWGIEALNVNGTQKEASEIFPQIVDHLRNMGNAGERNAAAQQLLGRNFAELIPLLNMSKEEMATYYSTANVMTDQQRAALEKYETAVKNLNGSVQNLSRTAGADLAPSFTNFATILTEGAMKGGAIDTFFSALDLGIEMALEGLILLEGRARAVMASIALLAMGQVGKAKEEFDRIISEADSKVQALRTQYALAKSGFSAGTTKTGGSGADLGLLDSGSSTTGTGSGSGTTAKKTLPAGVTKADLDWAVNQGNITWQEYNEYLYQIPKSQGGLGEETSGGIGWNEGNTWNGVYAGGEYQKSQIATYQSLYSQLQGLGSLDSSALSEYDLYLGDSDYSRMQKRLQTLQSGGSDALKIAEEQLGINATGSMADIELATEAIKRGFSAGAYSQQINVSDTQLSSMIATMKTLLASETAKQKAYTIAFSQNNYGVDDPLAIASATSRALAAELNKAGVTS
jgi:hypothetical protein